MVTGQLAHAVREQLRLGRLLPLGGPADGSWVTEQAAADVLHRAADRVHGVRLDGLRIALADPDAAAAPAVPPPPSALPPGPLRIDAECATAADEPLPVAAARLRAALLDAAEDRLGLEVEAVDLRVAEVLLDEPPRPRLTPHEPESRAQPRTRRTADASDPVALTVLSVPGVARLAPVLGFPHAVHTEDAHMRVELAVAAGHRALDVARRVRTAVADAADTPVTVAVLVTAVDPDQ